MLTAFRTASQPSAAQYLRSNVISQAEIISSHIDCLYCASTTDANPLGKSVRKEFLTDWRHSRSRWSNVHLVCVPDSYPPLISLFPTFIDIYRSVLTQFIIMMIIWNCLLGRLSVGAYFHAGKNRTFVASQHRRLFATHLFGTANVTQSTLHCCFTLKWICRYLHLMETILEIYGDNKLIEIRKTKTHGYTQENRNVQILLPYYCGNSEKFPKRLLFLSLHVSPAPRSY